MHVVVPEQRPLPSAEAVERGRYGNRHVDPDHPDLRAGREVARRVAVAGEDRGPVSVLVIVDEGEGLLVALRAHQRQHRAEDLVGVDRHLRPHPVEQAPAEEEPAGVRAVSLGAGPTVGAVRGTDPASVHHQRRAFFHPRIDVALHPAPVGAGHQRPHLRVRVVVAADPEVAHPGGETLDESVRHLIADRDRDRDRHAPFPGRAVGGPHQGFQPSGRGPRRASPPGGSWRRRAPARACWPGRPPDTPVRQWAWSRRSSPRPRPGAR